MFLKRMIYNPEEFDVSIENEYCVLNPTFESGKEIIIDRVDNKILLCIRHIIEAIIDPETGNMEIKSIQNWCDIYTDDKYIHIETDCDRNFYHLIYNINKSDNEFEVIVMIRLRNDRQISVNLVFNVKEDTASEERISCASVNTNRQLKTKGEQKC